MFRRDPLANPEPLIRRVYSYVAYRVGDGPDAEDLTSETFERALRYRKSYDPGKASPSPGCLESRSAASTGAGREWSSRVRPRRSRRWRISRRTPFGA